MRNFHVLLMRDKRLLDEHSDFKTLQDLQYLAGPIKAKDCIEAAKLAKRELRLADEKDGLHYIEITVLGHIDAGLYAPWFNHDFP